MSESESQQFEEELKTLRLVVKLGWCLIAGAFVMGGWVASLQISQSDLKDIFTDQQINVKNHGTELNRIGIWQAGIEGSKYTSLDANRDKSMLQQQIVEHDKRLTRIEDSITRIEKGIERIETKIGTKQ